MKDRLWKVGELAEITGVTVRTLHWYDEIGLLVPSHRTGAGHRLYAAPDVARLQQIRSLQALGLSLNDVGKALAENAITPREVIRRQIEVLNGQIEEKRKLCERLERIAASLDDGDPANVDDLLAAIKEMQMIEKIESCYTPEQLETLKQRREALGDEYIESVQNEWPELMRKLQAEMQKGSDPTSPEVRKLAARHEELLQQFHGGDPGIIESMKKVYQNMGDEVTKQWNFPMNSELGEFIKAAKCASE